VVGIATIAFTFAQNTHHPTPVTHLSVLGLAN
jgi:hypothetical protein